MKSNMHLYAHLTNILLPRSTDAASTAPWAEDGTEPSTPANKTHERIFMIIGGYFVGCLVGAIVWHMLTKPFLRWCGCWEERVVWREDVEEDD